MPICQICYRNINSTDIHPHSIFHVQAQLLCSKVERRHSSTTDNVAATDYMAPGWLLVSGASLEYRTGHGDSDRFMTADVKRNALIKMAKPNVTTLIGSFVISNNRI